MFELTVFNAAQIIDQLFDFICMYLLTSLSAKTRFYGFTIGFIGFIPATYLLVVTELWWLLLCMPIWFVIELRGVLNNWRAHKKLINGLSL